jgi:hypothetical protein
MKFRLHPQILQKRVRTWPPTWVESNSLPGTVLTGEIGVMTDVKLRGLNPCRLFITMHHENRSFSAILFFDDQSFCLQVFEFLKMCIGRPITDIGDMEFN